MCSVFFEEFQHLYSFSARRFVNCAAPAEVSSASKCFCLKLRCLSVSPKLRDDTSLRTNPPSILPSIHHLPPLTLRRVARGREPAPAVIASSPPLRHVRHIWKTLNRRPSRESRRPGASLNTETSFIARRDLRRKIRYEVKKQTRRRLTARLVGEEPLKAAAGGNKGLRGN